MRSFNTIFVFSLFLLLSLFSCEMKKELTGQIDKPSAGGNEIPLDKAGLLDLELKPYKEAEIPESKGGISGSDVVVLDVNEFAIDILDSIGNVYKHYRSYADMKNEGGLLLPAGRYSIRATMGEDVDAGFDTPFYSGAQECEISPKEVAKVITDCVLSNKKIVFRCSDKFLSKFEDDYTVLIDNGSGVLTTFKDEKRTVYFKNTGILQFTLYTTTRSGKRDLVYGVDLSKNQDVQEHNNILVDLNIVEDIPEPGDPVDPDEPEDPGEPEKPDAAVNKPTIKVDISLIERDYVIEVPSDLVDPDEPGENPGGDTDPSTELPVITATLDGKPFDLSQVQTVTETSKVVVKLYLPTGLKALGVLAEVGPVIKVPIDDIYNPPSDIKGVIDQIDLPDKGDSGMLTFDISAFMNMLFEGTNKFTITVADNNGTSPVQGVITLVKKE